MIPELTACFGLQLRRAVSPSEALYVRVHGGTAAALGQTFPKGDRPYNMEASPAALATPQSAGRAHSHVCVARSALSAALAALQGFDSDDEAAEERSQSALLQAAKELRVAAVSDAVLDFPRATTRGSDDSAVNAALMELAQSAREARVECVRLRAELQWERSRNESSRRNERAPAHLAQERAKVAKLWAALQAAYAETETVREERDALLAASGASTPDGKGTAEHAFASHHRVR
jgi:hypothetical protein